MPAPNNPSQGVTYYYDGLAWRWNGTAWFAIGVDSTATIAGEGGQLTEIRQGTGSPQNVVTAPVGTLYTRTDGGANTTLYVKESGTGSAGWVAK